MYETDRVAVFSISKWTKIALQNFGLFFPLTALKISASGSQTGSPELRLCLRFSPRLAWQPPDRLVNGKNITKLYCKLIYVHLLTI